MNKRVLAITLIYSFLAGQATVGFAAVKAGRGISSVNISDMSEADLLAEIETRQAALDEARELLEKAENFEDHESRETLYKVGKWGQIGTALAGTASLIGNIQYHPKLKEGSKFRKKVDGVWQVVVKNSVVVKDKAMAQVDKALEYMGKKKDKEAKKVAKPTKAQVKKAAGTVGAYQGMFASLEGYLLGDAPKKGKKAVKDKAKTFWEARKDNFRSALQAGSDAEKATVKFGKETYGSNWGIGITATLAAGLVASTMMKKFNSPDDEVELTEIEKARLEASIDLMDMELETLKLALAEADAE